MTAPIPNLQTGAAPHTRWCAQQHEPADGGCHSVDFCVEALDEPDGLALTAWDFDGRPIAFLTAGARTLLELDVSQVMQLRDALTDLAHLLEQHNGDTAHRTEGNER